MWKRIALLLSCMAAACAASPAFAQPSAIPVSEDAFIGGHPGTLKVSDDGVVFEARNPGHSRRWRIDEVRQLRVESSRKIVVETYRSRGWRGFGHSKTRVYRAAEPVPASWVAAALASTTRPVVTSVIPPRLAPARVSVTVNHEGTDTRGVLALYEDGLAFETPRDGFARFWRFGDLDSVLRQDRYRLSVTVYEGAREHVRPFLFTLLTDLPQGFYDELWREVNLRRHDRESAVPNQDTPARKGGVS